MLSCLGVLMSHIVLPCLYRHVLLIIIMPCCPDIVLALSHLAFILPCLSSFNRAIQPWLKPSLLRLLAGHQI